MSRQVIRGITTNPRTMLLGMLVFLASPSLYFFGREAHRQEDKQRRLTEPRWPTEPQRSAADLEVPEPRQAHTAPPTVPPWKPPVLPPEVFREVPPEECSRSELFEKIVDPSDYEFGCDEIEVK